MAYTFESIFLTTLYDTQPRNPTMKKEDHPELSFKLNNNPGVRKRGEAADSVVDPADPLHGHVEITSKNDFRIRAASIFLEGTSRNWVGTRGNDIMLDISKAEHKFLSQTLDIPISTLGNVAVMAEVFKSSIPFDFIISRQIPTADPQRLPDHCSQLPPSAELGAVFIDQSSGKRYAQPSISYELRALVGFSAQDEDAVITVESILPIIIIPHTEEFPPTSTHDFPTEFKEVDSKLLRLSMFGRPTGTMSVSMREPRPLSYNSSSVCAVTEAQLDLEFSTADLGDAVLTLQAMKITLYSLIRAKTFYGVESFPRLPSQTLVGVHGQTKMRDDIIRLPRTELPHVQWQFRYDLEGRSHGDSEVSPPSYPVDDSVASQSRPSTETQPQSLPQAPKGRWIATICHPIRVESSLLATFCSAIAARLYTVILHLKVSGIRRESFSLEVPLQVINLSPNGLRDGADVFNHTILGPTISDPPLFDRRSSASSWFSDETLETGDKPPHYHP
ncbi:hypothetical protein V490_00937 [Pseudogymnoascus sp. VKM F-3557]|nr:hypothetical protein V490_00937 [Pseudogymnoascus sp. VKM F-3557]